MASNLSQFVADSLLSSESYTHATYIWKPMQTKEYDAGPFLSY